MVRPFLVGGRAGSPGTRRLGRTRPIIGGAGDGVNRLVVLQGRSGGGRPAYTATMGRSNVDIAALTPDERLDLLEQLWDSLAPTPDAVPLTEAQRAELDRRLDDLDREGAVGVTWDEMLDRVRGHRR